MHRFLVVAHKTLGGAHLVDHLHELREDDPYCNFHLIVPQHHTIGQTQTEHDAVHGAQQVLDEMLDRLAAMRIGATGEVGDANPVYAVGDTIRREGVDSFDGIIVSTLPRGVSRWWLFDVPRRMAKAYPALPVTHLVAEEKVADVVG
jgi:GABA permease